MANRVGSGQHVGSDAAVCGREATRQAREGLGGAAATFGFVFASPDLQLGEALRAARSAAGTQQIIGCTTAGEVTERGLTHGGVSVLLVLAPKSVAESATVPGLMEDPKRAAAELCRNFRAAQGRGYSKGLAFSTTVVLADGLSGVGEELVRQILAQTQALHQIVGGAAGDEGRFKATLVGDPERAASDVAAALHVFGAAPWGVGIGHGLEATTGKMSVTRSKENVVYELDGRPAFEVYKEHARKRGIALTPSGAGEYLIANELGVMLGDRVARARAPLSVGADGSLTCAAGVRQGSQVAILDGVPKNMVAAARAAAEEAKANLQGAKPAGVLLFDCVCRGMILKNEFQKEIDAIRSVMGDVPVGGFLTYGEIANYGGSVEAWHNTTAVCVAIPE
ncbi:MAG TPA: FIST N-terminal domain-containing protein [Myxococcales bacterium]|nr:FIST N-terminal domain-containing protein [Myxococcales bacterium]